MTQMAWPATVTINGDELAVRVAVPTPEVIGMPGAVERRLYGRVGSDDPRQHVTDAIESLRKLAALLVTVQPGQLEREDEHGQIRDVLNGGDLVDCFHRDLDVLLQIQALIDATFNRALVEQRPPAKGLH